MKKPSHYLIYSSLIFLSGVALFVMNSHREREGGQEIEKKESAMSPVEAENSRPAEKVQVFLFHPTSRCYSCVTAGEYIEKTLEKNYSEELGSGRIEYREINIELPENKELAAKFKASGTSVFINPIIDGKDSIKEDTQVWRLISNEQAFTAYFSDKLKSLLGSGASVEAARNNDEAEIIFFSEADCPSCDKVKNYTDENKLKEKLNFEEEKLDENQSDNKLLADKANDCEMGDIEIEPPFLWAGGRCYMGDEDIIDFFDQKIIEI